jgi:hypothetical protein
MQHSDLLLKKNAIKTEKLKFTLEENNYTLLHGKVSSQYHAIRTHDRAQSKCYGAASQTDLSCCTSTCPQAVLDGYKQLLGADHSVVPLLTENNTVVHRILVVCHGTTPDRKLHSYPQSKV